MLENGSNLKPMNTLDPLLNINMLEKGLLNDIKKYETMNIGDICPEFEGINQFNHQLNQKK